MKDDVTYITVQSRSAHLRSTDTVHIAPEGGQRTLCGRAIDEMVYTDGLPEYATCSRCERRYVRLMGDYL